MSSSPGYSLLATFLVDLIVQIIFFIPSAILRTEKFYDLSASITYILCLILSLFVNVSPTWYSRSVFNPRQVIATFLSVLWTARLGLFLFMRVKVSGGDRRFHEIKESVPRFAAAWFAQVTWIFVTALPVYTINGKAPDAQPAFGTAGDIVGIIIWVFGFVIEVVADTQKWNFKRRTRTESEPGFISEGVWSWSRHPNYFGEITLWIGMFILCASGLAGAEWTVIISPIFVAGLICFASGIPLLEKSADERYGSLPEYQNYKERTSILVPWPPKGNV